MEDSQEGGFLAPLRAMIAKDRDLIRETRANALDMYSKGHCRLRLDQNDRTYSIELHEKFHNEDYLSTATDLDWRGCDRTLATIWATNSTYQTIVLYPAQFNSTQSPSRTKRPKRLDW